MSSGPFAATCLHNTNISLPSGAASCDPLLECLLVVAAFHRIPLSHEAAVAGLPLDHGRLTPDLIARAAKRGGLSARMVRQSLDRLNRSLLPAILLFKDGNACVLLDLDLTRETAGVVFPELDETRVDIPLAELVGRFGGYVLYLRPLFRFDARAPEVGQVRGRHWFWSVLGENLSLYRDVLLASFIISLLALAMPLFIRIVYDRVIPNHAIHTLWVLATGVAVVITGDLLLRTMRSYFLDLAGKRVDVKLSTFIMERVLGTRLEHRPESAGSFAANFRAFETVRDFITSTTITAFIELPFALIFLLMIGLIAWQLTIPIMLGMLVALLTALSVQGKMHELSETTYRAAAQRNATLIESLVCLETVKALGAEGRMQGFWEQKVRFFAQVSTRLRLLSTGTLNTATWVSQSVNVVILLLGVYLLIDNQLTIGGLIACSMLASRALAPITQVAGLLTQYHHATTAFHSLERILSNPVERPDNSNFLTRHNFQGDLEFKDVQFRYSERAPEVLGGLSFRIRAGEKVAVLGRVGSGKTTLLKLMLGLYQPCAGAVFVDGIDLRQLDPAELRRSCGYVSQESTLFYGTLRDNLTISNPTADDAAIISAARAGALVDFVNTNPQGFDMLIGERGESLSGGQRQGVAIARAVIKNPPILLLDEPTGAMDHTSEELVKQEFRSFADGRTVVLVTHRTSLLELVDRILVLDAGKLVADGPRDMVIEALRTGKVGRA